MARPCRIKALTEGRAGHREKATGHRTCCILHITQPKQQLAKDTMTTFAASRMRPRTDLASSVKPRITRRFGIHGRRARKYRPLGNTLGNGADSSALQVPMLTNFISMHCTSLGTSKRHGIAFAPALQKNHPSAASPVYAPAKPAAPSPLHLVLFYFILFDFIIALFCTAVLWSGENRLVCAHRIRSVGWSGN
ncbi:hypothetical protein HDV62DRAFT_66552 [Trichoderma sp. SZMC 28011]